MNLYMVTMKMAETLTCELNKTRQNGDLLSEDEVSRALAHALDKHDCSHSTPGRAVADYEARVAL